MAFSVKAWLDKFGSGGAHEAPSADDIDNTHMDATAMRDLETRLSGYTDSTVLAHTADTSAAHAASAVSFSPTGTIAGTDVQAAVAEVASERVTADAALDTRVASLESAQSGSGVILPWQADHAYAAGEAMTQSGNTYTRNSAGTSRGSFDTTEEAAWTVLPTDATVIENVHLVTSGGASQTIPEPESASQTWITLDSASCALTLPTPLAGASFLLGLKQDDSGGRVVTWVGEVVWLDGDAPTLGSDPNAYTLISFVSDPVGAAWIGMSRGSAAAVAAYRAAVMADSPISYWRLGESAGTTAVDETGVNDGTYTGGVTLGSDGLIGSDADTATTFDGTDGHVVVKAGRIISALSSWTVEAWVKPATLAAGNVFYGESGSSGNDVFRLQVELNGEVTLQFTDSAGTSDEFKSGGGATVPSAVTAHIAAVRDGSDYLLYVNGTLAKTATFTASSTLTESTTQSWIGADLKASPGAGAFGIFFPGVIDEVAVYGSALSADRVAAHYDAAQA